MNKENSPVLDKILNGHKFKSKRSHQNYTYQVVDVEMGLTLDVTYSTGKTVTEAWIDELNTSGNILSIALHIMGKTTSIYFDCTYDLQLLE